MKKPVSYCTVNFTERSSDGRTGKLSVRYLDQHAGATRTLGEKEVGLNEIQDACKQYWGFVDEAIQAGQLREGEKGLKNFFDELMTSGAALAERLLDQRAREQLWGVAAQSDILVFSTGLLNVPWEALYNAADKGGGFLSEQCAVLTRWPEATGVDRHLDRGEPSFSRERVFCLDKVLAGDTEIFGATCLEAMLKDDGEEVYLTSEGRSALTRHVSDVRLVQWICEHDGRGLRLTEDVFYTVRDAMAHRFPRGSTLVLTSCRSGAQGDTEGSIASGICVASQCTVIAPSSVVAARVGVSFARKINSILKGCGDGAEMRLADLWSKVKGAPALPGLGTAHPPVTAERCYALWYGIYGNGETVVGGPLRCS